MTTDEIGWLIEQASTVFDSRPTYWAGGDSWTTADSEAVRFARSVDAERVARTLDSDVRVTEHMWPAAWRHDGPTTPATTVGAPGSTATAVKWTGHRETVKP